MASKKIYAVRKGRVTGIYQTWADCKAAVDGYTGAEYKGFVSLEEALEYMGPVRKQTEAAGSAAGKKVPAGKMTKSVKTVKTVRAAKSSAKLGAVPEGEKILPDSPDKVIAYVDGSYNHSLKKYAFGCVFILPDGNVYTESGNGDNPDSLALRNVTGEMLGAMFAVRFAMVNGFHQIEIRYDYEGIEKWVTGAWKSRTDLTQKYAKAMQGWSRAIQIHFTKVAAHTNVFYNEMADQLAKGALTGGYGVPEVCRIEDMRPFEQG